MRNNKKKGKKATEYGEMGKDKNFEIQYIVKKEGVSGYLKIGCGECKWRRKKDLD